MKTVRKYMVNAFTKYAEKAGWEDSAKHPRGLRACGFKDSRQWGRQIAAMYSAGGLFDLPDEIIEMHEEAAISGYKLTQEDYDIWVEEEISCW